MPHSLVSSLLLDNTTMWASDEGRRSGTAASVQKQQQQQKACFIEMVITRDPFSAGECSEDTFP